jgi:hypothetical protein
VDDLGHSRSGGSKTASSTVALTVNPVNDPPTFVKGNDVAVLEDAGLQTVANWATNISPGPADEAAQTVQFIVTTDNPGLFTQPPAISVSGQLTFTLTADANGSSTMTVTLKDSGGVERGGVDTSLPQTFKILATPVNDAPSFVKGADQSVGNSGSSVSVPNWATGIAAGPSNEAGQPLSFVVQSDNAGLFATQPAISSAGTLTFTPKAGVSGVATVSVQLLDNGGIAKDGHDTSPSQQFAIAVSSDGMGPVLGANLLRDTAPGETSNTDGITFDPRIGGQVLDASGVASLTGSVDGGNPLAISVNSDGSFVFDPPLARNGTQDGTHIVRL